MTEQDLRKRIAYLEEVIAFMEVQIIRGQPLMQPQLAPYKYVDYSKYYQKAA